MHDHPAIRAVEGLPASGRLYAPEDLSGLLAFLASWPLDRAGVLDEYLGGASTPEDRLLRERVGLAAHVGWWWWSRSTVARLAGAEPHPTGAMVWALGPALPETSRWGRVVGVRAGLTGSGPVEAHYRVEHVIGGSYGWPAASLVPASCVPWWSRALDVGRSSLERLRGS